MGYGDKKKSIGAIGRGWLTWGDKNSKFFHASTIQRSDRNQLARLQNKDGDWVEGQSNIMRAIEDFYKDL